jgi:hypothetical protein
MEEAGPGLASDSVRVSSPKDSVSRSAEWLVLIPVSSCQDLGVSPPTYKAVVWGGSH